MGNKKLDEYSPETFRDDYFRVSSYHDSNDYFMKSLYKKLMELNKDKYGIRDLVKINDRLDAAMSEQSYFGHKMDDEISMIQTLNEFHKNLCLRFDDKTVDAVNTLNVDFKTKRTQTQKKFAFKKTKKET